MSCKKAFFLLKKVVYYLIVLSVVFNLFGFYNSPTIAYAVSGVPFTIGYQGRLTNSSGDLLGGSGTTFYFKFSIYDASSGGNKLWPSSAPSEVSATVRQGVFNVNIGDTKSGYPDQLNYNFNNNNTVYLQVSVSSSSGGSFQDLTPRQLIAASAFAQLSSAVSGTTTPSSFGTTSPFSSATHVSIEASTTASIPLGIRAISGQTADLFQIQEPNDGVSRITVDSGFRFGVGTSSIGSDLGLFGLAVEGSSIIGNYLTTSFITATSTTATSTFKGGVVLARDAGNVGIGTSTPTGTFAVSGNSYFSGGVTLGTSNTDATTTPGHLRATLLHSDTTIVAGGLISCTGDIETDANGVFHCGTDQTGASANDLQDAYDNSAADAQITTTNNKNLIFFSDNTATDANIVIALHTSGGGQFQVVDTTGSATTTRLVITRDGSLGIGTTSPGGAFAVGIASTTILNGNLYVLATTTVGALNATNTLAVASSSPGSGNAFSVVGHSVLSGNVNIVNGTLDVQNSATSTFDGGLNITTTGGLSSASGITLSGGDLLLSSGKITQSSSATSTIPNFNGSTLINAGSLFVSGAGTSTIVNADALVKGNLTVGTGLNVNGGDLVVTGKIVSSNSATSSFTGAISAAGLASSQGLTLSAGDFLFTGQGKITAGGSATSTIPQLTTPFLSTQQIFATNTALSLGQSGQNTTLVGLQLLFTDNALLNGTSTYPNDNPDYETVVATSSVANVLTLRGFGPENKSANSGLYAGNLLQLQDSTATNLIVVDNQGKLGLGSTTPAALLSVGAATSVPAFLINQTGTGDYLHITNGGAHIFTVNSSNNVGIGTSTIGNKLEIAGGAVFKGNVNIEATSTASSFNATSTLTVGTSSPNFASVRFSVNGNAFINGGLALGDTSATTAPGQLRATLLHSDTQIVAEGIPSCSGSSALQSDAAGVIKCGSVSATASPGGNDTQVQYNNATVMDGRSLFTFNNANGNVTVGGDLFVNASDIQIGNGLVATSTLTGEYGKLGLGSTTPYGQFAIEATSLVGSNTPIFVIGDQGTATPLFYVSGNNGNIGIATDSPGAALAVDAIAIFNGAIANSAAGTSTFEGGLNIKTTGGLSSASGITLSGGDLLLSSGKITQSSSATSTIPNFNGSTLINAGSLFVSGAGTSTIVNADALVKGNLTVGTGLNVNGGDLVVTGKIVSSNSATSSFTGAISAAGLASSQGLTLSAGDFLFTGQGKITAGGSATSTIPQISSTFHAVQALFSTSTNLSVGGSGQITSLAGSEIFFSPVNDLFIGTTTIVAEQNNSFVIEATSTVANVLTLRGFGSLDDYSGNALDIQTSAGSSTLTIKGIGSLGIATTTFQGVQIATSTLISRGTLYVEGTTTAASLIATSTLGVGTSTPTSLVQAAIGGNTYLTGGLSIGASATTVPGSVQAGGLGDFVTGLIVRNLVSCTGDIETDAAGLLHCGTDVTGGASSSDLQDAYNNAAADAQITTTDNKNLIFFSDNTATDANIVVALHSAGGGNFLVQNTTGSATTTVLTITRDGSLGIGTTSPGGALAITATSSILGNGAYVYGQLTSANVIATTTAGSGFGTTVPGYTLGIGGFGVVKGNFNIEATSTASSFNATSTLTVGTSSPNFASVRFSVNGNAFINGGLALGDTSATTAPGQLRATLLHSDTQIVAEGIPSCSGSSALQSDAAGVIKCGSVSATASPGGNDTQVQYNNATVMDGRSLFTFNNSTGAVTVAGALNLGGSSNPGTLSLGNGLVATTTITPGYGRLGFGSTTPYGQVSIEAVDGVVGSTTPIFVIGDSGTDTPFFLVSGINGNVGIGTTSPMEGFTVASSSILQTPKQPRIMGGANNAGDADAVGVYVVGRYAYTGSGPNTGACSGSTLTGCEVLIYDVSEPASPVALGGVDTATGAIKIFVSGRYAYVVKAANDFPCSSPSVDLSGCEFEIIDISNPASSTPISGVDFGATAWGDDLFVSGRYAYVVKDNDSGTCSGTTLTGCEFSIYDISNPYSPTPVGGVDLGNVIARGIDVAGSYAYIVKDNNTGTCSGTTLTGCEFSIYDISNPSSPHPVGGVNFSTAGPDGDTTVKVSGRYAHIGKANNIGTCSGTTLDGCEYAIYDISNPSSPAAVGGVNFGVAVIDLDVAGRYVYIGTNPNSISPCNESAGLIGCEFAVYDISNPSNPSIVGGVNSAKPTGIEVLDVKVAGHYVYIGKLSATGTCSGTTVDGCEFVIYDISGVEASSGTFHSLEAGNLQVRNNIIANGYLQVTDSVNIGSGGLSSYGPIAVIGTTTVANSIAAFFGGNVGIGSTTPGTKLDVLGNGVFKGGLYVQATTTTSSLIASSTLAVATSSPATNAVLNVGGNTYLSGGLSAGRTATTTSGGIMGTLLDVTGVLQARGLVNCDSIDTDDQGVMRCGVDSTGAGGTITGSGTTNNIMKWTASTQAGDSIMTELNGNIGLSSTTPGVKLGVMGNEIIAATSTASAFLATSSLGVATTSLGGNVQFAVNGNAYITGGLVVGGASSTPGFRMSATTTGLTVAGNLQLLNPEKKTGGGKFDLCWSSSDYTITIIDVLGNDCNATTDVSEKMVTTEDVEEGDTVSLIPMLPGQVRDDYNTFAVEKSKLPYDTKAIGIVARYGKTHILGGEPDSNPANLPTAPISLAGRTPAKVSLENGPIHLGDRLTTASNKPGHLMKATKSGWVVGIALEELAASATETGKILVFLDPFSWKADNNQDTTIIIQNADIVASGTPMSFVINQKGSGDILQLQQNDTNRFLVHNDGTTEINAKVADSEAAKKLLVVKSNDSEVFSINTRGDTAFKGVITIENDSFAGSITTNDQGYAQVNFSHPLGSGKPSVQLTSEGEEFALAQIYKFIKDDSQNYIGFIIRAIKYASGQPAANLNVDYLVTGKEDGYSSGLTGPITLPVSTSPITFPPIIISDQQSLQNTPTNTTDTPTSSTADQPVDTEPPVITINGLNPTEIEIGAAYSDLGVTVTDNVSQNLGYKMILDGGPEVYPSEFQLDTSTAGEHTITYKATDQAGNTSTATRVVNVVDLSTPTISSPSSGTDVTATTTPQLTNSIDSCGIIPCKVEK